MSIDGVHEQLQRGRNEINGVPLHAVQKELGTLAAATGMREKLAEVITWLVWSAKPAIENTKAEIQATGIGLREGYTDIADAVRGSNNTHALTARAAADMLMGGSADMSNNVTMLPISVDQALAALSVANLFLGGIARSTTLLECALGEIDACRQVIDHESRAFEAYM